MAEDRYVRTHDIREAVRGRETEVLKALGIACKSGASHSRCPYPDHDDANPSWRWDQAKARAFCSCIDGSHTILDVLAHCEGVDFEIAKVRAAEILGRQDLIKEKGSRHHLGMDAASLLQPAAEERDDDLVPAYLGYRLGVEPCDVPLPSTPVVGRRSLPYYDLPVENGGSSTLVGGYPCVIFGTASPDGRTHAQRIYVKPDGKGKADLGVGPDGRQRDAKKSAKLPPGVNSAGCAILWGDPATAPHLILAEGPETAAALALAHKAELIAGKVGLAAALSTGGIRGFRPWPANRQVTVAADRDEAKPEADRAFKAGEKAARDFARKHHHQLDVRIALPGSPGADADWLDALRVEGIEAVRSGIASAEAFMPPPQDSAGPDAEAGSPDPEQIERELMELVERAKADPGAPFERDAVVALASASHATPAAYQRAIRGLKQAGARMRDLDREIRRANLRVIEGGGASSGFEATIEAGPYFITQDGMIAWRKETREGVVPQPLCNFTARIMAEEVLDDGAEQHTVFVVEGELPGGRLLSPTRIPAERYPAMGWVTEAWGMAPVIFAGQGRRDHLRVAIQMLSGAVPRRTGWSEELLAAELAWLRDERFNLDLTGFDASELERLLAIVDGEAASNEAEDEVPEPPEDPVSKPGDLWILGNHRLLCGDATVLADVERVLGGQLADMTFCDPPYNVDYANTPKDKLRGKHRPILNDNLGSGFEAFLYDACVNILSVTKGACYICMSSSELHRLQRAFVTAGGKWSTFVIWAKNTFTLGRADYQRQYEPILYGWNEGSDHYWCGARDQGDVWFFDKPVRNDLHPTMKPVALVERAVRNSSKSRDIVLDPFGGSGSTLIACEKTGRQARLMELDPKYCDVILQRWQDWTGAMAVLEEGGRSFGGIADSRKAAEQTVAEAAST